MIDLNNIAREAYKTSKTREENGANIKTDTLSVLKHCAAEVVEATYAFLKGYNGFYAELVDIITCVLIIAGHHNIDIESALKDVQEKNKARAEGRGDKK